MKSPVIFAFTDCKDSNTITRLTARLSSLFESSFVHAKGIDKDVEASGCLLDTLDALRIENREAILIGNLAPRSDKHYKNGAPFYIGKVGKVIIIANRTCFDLIAKIELIDTIYETDVETVCSKYLSKTESKRIANSQFRSFEYIPILARWIYEKKKIPTSPHKIVLAKDNKIWWVDNFGNCKTTITETELKKRIVKNSVSFKIKNKVLKLPFYQKLADVPKGKLACIIGSSGYANTRFAEIVIQGKSASKKLKIVSGEKIY